MGYIQLCHKLIFSQLVVETDKRLTSQGSITNPRDKWCPALLSSWPDFLHQQKAVFRDLHSAFPVDTEAFESQDFLHYVQAGRFSRGKENVVALGSKCCIPAEKKFSAFAGWLRDRNEVRSESRAVNSILDDCPF
ncbi:hypothetical protein F4778DRAFT_102670 [Xylariomycetidae sp. FL2044]|nr:hypothetical protein F4778DRAFT_102670 [Xylariomycetidae sp. FL2044]